MSDRQRAIERSSPPRPGILRSFEFPHVHSDTLATGLGLRVARLPRLPVVTAVLVMDAGESRLGRDKAGLGVLTGNALDGGTRLRSGAELAQELEGLGIGLGVSTGWASCTVTVSCLADRFAEAMPLLAEVVTMPLFPDEEVARFRSQRLAVIEQRKMDPGSLASDESARFIYAEDVPFARPLGGFTGSIEPLGSADLSGYADAYYRPGGGGLVIVGDVDVGEVRGMAEEHLGGWTGAAVETGDFEARPRTRVREIHVIHRPGAVQSEFRIGHVGVPRTSPDFYSLLVLNTILGGSFTSRLNLNLRERHGFTYGVRSHFGFRRQAGPFSVSASVATDVTAAAIREVFTEVTGLLDGGPTEDEVDGARDYLAGVFPLTLESTSQVAGKIAELIIHRLPDDHHGVYRSRIRGVTTEEVWAAGRRHIRPDEMAIVVVGDAGQVTESLKGLELGPVQVHEPS